jgi:hypothetical protein
MSRNQIIQFCQQILTFTKSLSEHPLKRDGPVFFSSTPVKVAGDERTLMAIAAPCRAEACAKEDRVAPKPCRMEIGEGGKPT